MQIIGVLIKAIAFTWRSFNESEIMLESSTGEILTEVDEDTSRNYRRTCRGYKRTIKK